MAEAIEASKRNFLLVMATGTGKTRIIIGLIDLVLRAKRAQRILFLADRRELVKQALREFKASSPAKHLGELRVAISRKEIEFILRLIQA